MRDTLTRPLYRGTIVYGRSAKAYGRELGKFSGREKGQIRKPEGTWLHIDAPHLRIVSEELAAVVDVQRSQRRARYLNTVTGKLLGRPAPHAVRHLLSGLLQCSCGASFEAQSGRRGQRKGGVYVCSAARRKGQAVCASRVHLPAAQTEALIMEAVERELLDADVFGEVLDLAVHRLLSEAPARGALTAELERVTRELGNLSAAIAAGGEMQTLVAEIRTRESRKAEIERALQRSGIDRRGLRDALAARLADWKHLLRSRPMHGQTVLRMLLNGPILIGAPGDQSVTWEAQVNASGILGMLSTQLASPAGFEPALPA